YPPVTRATLPSNRKSGAMRDWILASGTVRFSAIGGGVRRATNPVPKQSAGGLHWSYPAASRGGNQENKLAPHDTANDRVRVLVEAVRAGLSQPRQKELPCSLLYDELGSTLFQAITLLPEYGVTRAEMRLFHDHAADMAALIPHVETVAELGSGD